MPSLRSVESRQLAPEEGMDVVQLRLYAQAYMRSSHVYLQIVICCLF